MGAQKLIVLDTNVIVSGLLAGKKPTIPSIILALTANDLLTPCYDERMMAEYCGVTARPHLRINQKTAGTFLRHVQDYGLRVDPLPLANELPDPDDLAFYEVARFCFCPLITGNKKHFPDEPLVLSPAQFYHSLRETSDESAGQASSGIC